MIRDRKKESKKESVKDLKINNTHDSNNESIRPSIKPKIMYTDDGYHSMPISNIHTGYVVNPSVAQPINTASQLPQGLFSQQGIASSQQGTSSPQQGISSPQQGTSSSQQGTSSPQQGTSSPQQGIFSPQQGIVSLPQGIVSSQQGIAPSSQGTSSPQQGIAPLSQGIASSQQGTAPLSQGIVSQQQGISSLTHHNINGGKGWQRVFGYNQGTDIQPIQIIKSSIIYGITFSHSGIGIIPAGDIYIYKNILNSESKSDNSEYIIGVINISNDISNPCSFTILPGESNIVSEGIIVKWENHQGNNHKLERSDRISLYGINLLGANIGLYIESQI